MTGVSTDLADTLGDLVERFDHGSMAVYDIEDSITLVALMGGEFRAGVDVAAGAQPNRPGYSCEGSCETVTASPVRSQRRRIGAPRRQRRTPSLATGPHRMRVSTDHGSVTAWVVNANR